MRIKQFNGKHYPVEYLIFQCQNIEEAKQYLQKNDIWTNALAKKKGFISSTSYLNESNPGELHIEIIWENLDDWLSIDKKELIKINKQFNDSFGFPYESKDRLHTQTNFGLHKVSHYEIIEDKV